MKNRQRKSKGQSKETGNSGYTKTQDEDKQHKKTQHRKLKR